MNNDRCSKRGGATNEVRPTANKIHNSQLIFYIGRLLSIDLFVEIIVVKIELPGMNRTGSVALLVEAQAQLDNFHAIDDALEDGVLVLGLSVEDARRKSQDAWKLSVQSDVTIIGHDRLITCISSSRLLHKTSLTPSGVSLLAEVMVADLGRRKRAGKAAKPDV